MENLNYPHKLIINRLLIVSLIIFLTNSCKNDTKKKKNVEHKSNGIEIKTIPIQNTYLDYVLNDLGTTFICINVSNKNIVKKLIIENQKLYTIYTSRRVKLKDYVLKLKPIIQSNKELELSDEDWIFFKSEMLDTNDCFLDEEYKKNINKYFKNNQQVEIIPQIIFLKLVLYAYEHEDIFYRDCLSGLYFIKSFKKIRSNIK